ncbi:MAG: sensor histidine kinase [Oscillibacter sp.]
MEIDNTLLLALLPNVATQFRSALGNIHLASAALISPEEREEHPELDAKAALLDQSYYQMLRLVNNLSATAYLLHSAPLPLQDRDLVELIQTQCEKTEALAELMGIELRFSCALPTQICAVNGEAMEQLLFQLLSNALKFTPAGGSVTVELRLAGERVLLSVIDTGCGIDEDLLPTLFDRYLHRELMSPQPHGLGLGLTLCRHIAQGHGGTMMAESKAGVGSRVTLAIPNRKVGISGLSDVAFDYAGGFNTTLLALADALPREAFLQKNQD